MLRFFASARRFVASSILSASTEVFADFLPLRFEEGVSHSSADDECVLPWSSGSG